MWWWFTSVALGCGGMFGPDGAQVFSASQQAIFERTADGVVVEYLAGTSGELQDFGWVVPIPGGFLSLEDGDPDRFIDLAERTALQPVWHGEEASGGCAGDAKGGGLDRSNGTLGDVTLIAEGTTGLLDYAVLEAGSTTDLVNWLDDHGWVTGDNWPSLDEYVAEGGWQFVAIAANADTAPGSNDAVQSAVRIAYEGDQMVFPARMSRYSNAEEQSTTLYVVGDERATLSGWKVDAFPDIDEVGSDFVAADRIRALTAGDPAFVETFADELDGAWVTRFDTVSGSTAYDADVDLAYYGGTISLRPRIDLYESEDARESDSGGCAVVGGGGTAWAWLGLAALVRRRRRN